MLSGGSKKLTEAKENGVCQQLRVRNNAGKLVKWYTLIYEYVLGNVLYSDYINAVVHT